MCGEFITRVAVSMAEPGLPVDLGFYTKVTNCNCSFLRTRMSDSVKGTAVFPVGGSLLHGD